MSESTTQQRANWQAFECRKDQMVSIAFGPDRILVAPPTQAAWAALANVLLAHAYELRTPDTDSYNCREIKGGGGRSLHSFGIALDVNWDTNPYKETPSERKVKYSDKATQVERAEDVRLGVADTDMTPGMIADVLAIKTNNGKTVFEWGGNWNTIKDTMHFEIDVTPADLASGINQSTVKQPPPGATWPPPRGGMAGDDSVLSFGARGPRVSALQQALAAQNISVGAIDGIFGSQTRTALREFQAARGLPQTGIADDATLAALGLAAAAKGGAPPQADKTATAILEALLAALGGKPPTPAPAPGPVSPDLLGGLIAALLGKAVPASGATPAPGPVSPDLLGGLIAALLGKAVPASGATPEAAKAMQEAVMSPIDKLLGGEAMTGKKTALAVVAYTLLSLVQGVAPDAMNAGTASVLTTLITAFGGLGLLGKVDRAVNLLGVVAAAKQPPAGTQT